MGKLKPAECSLDHVSPSLECCMLGHLLLSIFFVLPKIATVLMWTAEREIHLSPIIGLDMMLSGFNMMLECLELYVLHLSCSLPKFKLHIVLWVLCFSVVIQMPNSVYCWKRFLPVAQTQSNYLNLADYEPHKNDAVWFEHDIELKSCC